MRGSIEAIYNSDGAPRTVNIVPLEQYVAGVVPNESPAGWGDARWRRSAGPAVGVPGARGPGRGRPLLRHGRARLLRRVRRHLRPRLPDLPGDAQREPADRPGRRRHRRRRSWSSPAGRWPPPSTRPRPAATRLRARSRPCPTPATPSASRAPATPTTPGRPRVPVSTIDATWPQLGTLESITITGRNGYGEWGGRVTTMTLVGSSSDVLADRRRLRRWPRPQVRLVHHQRRPWAARRWAWRLTPTGRLLGGGQQRRRRRLRRRQLRGIGRHPRPGPTGGGHGRHPRRPRLLAGGLRRRASSATATPPSTGRPAASAQQAGGGHGRHPRRPRLLAGGRRRRHLRLRRRRLLRLDGRASTSTNRWWAWPPPPTATATGWWPPTAASSPSATPPSTGRWAAIRSTDRWWAWPPAPGGGGYWLVAADGGIFSFGEGRLLRVDRQHRAQRAGGGDGRHQQRTVATGWWPPTAASSPSVTPTSTAPRSADMDRPVEGRPIPLAGARGRTLDRLASALAGHRLRPGR